MIRKVYKPDGSPDLREWVVECNGCGARHTLHDTTAWLIPIPPEMPDYCPVCVNVIAAHHITEALGGAS